MEPTRDDAPADETVPTTTTAGPAVERSTKRQGVAFLVVGAGGWCINVAIFALLHRAGVGYAYAAAFSYWVSNVAMWLGNRTFTFGPSGGNVLLEYLRYLFVGLVTTLATNLLVLTLLVDVFGMPELPAQMISLSVAVPVAFLAFRHWTFAQRR